MKIVSVFDGMSCGKIAFRESGIPVERYVASEVDKYAIQTSSHNFPEIEQVGDVFKVDFTQYEGFDGLIGGSPCTKWSIAQKNGRETEASGQGWDWFCQYVRALKEIKPKFFIYENNRSMSNSIRDCIRETFGFEEVCINSALLSAQNRVRYYWVGIRNSDGTYRKVNVPQPGDRGIMLGDVLDCAYALKDKANCLCGNRGGSSLVHDLTESRHNLAAEPVNVTEEGKAYALRSSYFKTSTANFVNGGGHYPGSAAAEPVRVGVYPNASKNPSQDSKQYRIYGVEGKSTCLCGEGGGMGAKTGLYAIPVRIPEYDQDKSRPVDAHYSKLEEKTWFKRVFNENQAKQQHDYLAIPVNTTEDGKAQTIKAQAVHTNAQNICGQHGGTFGAFGVAENVPVFAEPCEVRDGIPIKAISGSDGKVYPVYLVEDGKILIKDKWYPIKLPDGYWLIRKLTVSECMRLQTVPDWFEFPVSNTQAYRQLGNGWTIAVIQWLLRCLIADWTKEILYD